MKNIKLILILFILVFVSCTKQENRKITSEKVNVSKCNYKIVSTIGSSIDEDGTTGIYYHVITSDDNNMHDVIISTNNITVIKFDSIDMSKVSIYLDTTTHTMYKLYSIKN